MFRVISRISSPKGELSQPVIGTLQLPFDMRQKGRFRTASKQGHDVGVFLPRGEVLKNGDYLVTECGQTFKVVAKQEAVIEARTDDWQAFSRACYHMGNRHVPMQIGDCWLRFQPDHVLEEMLRLQGLECRALEAEFTPENGAYHGGAHHHDHHHHEDHSH